MIHRVSDRTFDRDALSSTEPVLVYFWEDDCTPCRTISPVLEEIAGATEGRVKVVSLEVGQNRAIKARYHIHGLPTLIVFVEGEVAARRVGAMVEKDDLMAWVNAAIERETPLGG
jgi:thioredoxin 1